MKITPFFRVVYETDIGHNEVSNRLKQNTNDKDWELSLSKAINNRVMEGDISNTSFTIVMGKYGLTYGKTSLLPIMKGRVWEDNSKSKTFISIIIRPFKTGVIILSVFYVLSLISLGIGIQRGDLKLLIVISLFLIASYLSIITKFNSEVITYTKFMEDTILQGNYSKR